MSPKDKKCKLIDWLIDWLIELAFIVWWTQGTWVASLAALSMPRTANVTMCHLLGLGCLHSDRSLQPRLRNYAEVQRKALMACTAKWASALWCLSGGNSSCSSDKYIRANVIMSHIILWVWACTLYSILTKCECLHCAAVCWEGSPVAKGHPHCALPASNLPATSWSSP